MYQVCPTCSCRALIQYSRSLALHGSHCYPPVMWLETFCETLSLESPLETLWGFYYFCSSELPTAHRSLLHQYFAIHLKYVPKMVFRKQKLARSAATFYISRMVPLGIRFCQALPIIAAGKYSTSFSARFIGMGRKRLSEVPFFLSYCFLSSCVLAVGRSSYLFYYVWILPGCSQMASNLDEGRSGTLEHSMEVDSFTEADNISALSTDDYIQVQVGGGRREPTPVIVTPTRLRQKIKATGRDTGLV
ncbi:hypothetical protein EDD16DRAFT_1027724 [Pisolithus croceorrhizus]|nr:hypothetical protein EDD16DRAFT_1027724 [Pisolithus croceorrhizus]